MRYYLEEKLEFHLSKQVKLILPVVPYSHYPLLALALWIHNSSTQRGTTLKAGHQKNLGKKSPQELSHKSRQKRYPQTLLARERPELYPLVFRRVSWIPVELLDKIEKQSHLAEHYLKITSRFIFPDQIHSRPRWKSYMH